MQPNEQAIYSRLHALGIPYTRREHAAVHTMEECLPVGHEIGTLHCKNLFLCNRQQTEHYLLLLDFDKRFRTAQVSKALGVSRLSFGAPEKLLRFLCVIPGAVNPLSLLEDQDLQVRLVADRELFTWERVSLHPGVNTATIVMAVRDLFERYLPAIGHEATVIDLKEADNGDASGG